MTDATHIDRHLRLPDAPSEPGITSRTLHADDATKVVHFAFSTGEELSEHTSSRPAIIHILTGAMDLSVAGEDIDGLPGTWVHMEAGTVHALRARTPSTMILTLLPRAVAGAS